ncbi:MAG TPA: alpha/beta hydrolase [Acidimicrobiales bacterium]|nr:alpha/beta hydrolase [Acidimicrobiales bacterium]
MSVDNLDPELRPFLDGVLELLPGYDADRLDQIRAGLRAVIDGTPLTRPDTVSVEDVTVPGPPGDPDVTLRVYRPTVATDLVPGLYWMHGGGMMIGSMDMDDALLVGAAEQLGVAVVSVEYRLAPEHPDPAPVEDCYAGLVWTAAHASDYGIDGNRIAVGGASAGGGLAAGTALLARDRGGPHVAFQLLLEPMLDDRFVTFSSTQYEGSVIWDRSDNARGWASLLGDRAGSDSVSPYAAPARATDLTGLPPALIDVGEVETFRDECIEYARRLFAAGVPTELHVYPGAFHGFDLLAPDSAIARLAWHLRWNALARALNVPSTT